MSLPVLLFVNDNHFVVKDEIPRFLGSTFHNFLSGFKNVNPMLSSPTLDIDKLRNKKLVEIDNITVLVRPGYGTAISFYTKLPVMFFKYFVNLLEHIRKSDIVILVMPACTAPMSYMIARIYRRPIAVYVVGDVEEVVKSNYNYSRQLRLLSNIVSRWEFFFTKYISRRHTTFVLGKKIREKMELEGISAIPAMTSLILDKDIHLPDKNQSKIITLRLVSVGRLSVEKGFDTALWVVSQLVKNGFDVHYTIVGEGDNREHLLKIAKELNVTENLDLVGRLSFERINSEIFPKSNIFLLPSLSEGMPKVLLEAMSAGLPVIASDVGGVSEIIGENEERGWLIKADDILDMFHRIVECANSPDIRDKKLQAAYKYIKQHTLNVEAEKIENIILKLNVAK